MTVDIFSVFQFENALQDIVLRNPSLKMVSSLGIVMGEYVFDVVLDDKVSVRIRSSVGQGGISAEAGQNSIRLWLCHHVTDTQLSKLPNLYVTRTPGWADRLALLIDQLAEYRALSGDCPHCQHPMYVYRSKTKGVNYGRLFTSCFNCSETFYWLEDAPNGNIITHLVYFEQVSSVSPEVEPEGDGVPFPSDEAALPGPEAVEDVHTPGEGLPQLNVGDGSDPAEAGWSPSSSPEQSTTGSTSEETDEPSELFSESSVLDALGEEEEEESTVQEQSVERPPNPEQSEAIFAPLEGAYRVLAPPGSGKTFLLIRRIRHLLDSGVNMANILAVTFNKSMADELYNRLVHLMPEIEQDENNAKWSKRNISTIHAACFRMLKDYGDKRQYPDREMWKIKAFIQERAVVYFPREEYRPSWKEILDWIYTAKHEGLEGGEFAMLFFAQFPDYAEGIENIRLELDEFMKVNKFLLFQDMLYDVEMLLRHDPVFTRRFQTLYKYILVDEGQDTSGQAMRILTTLAAPQDNFFIVGDTDQLLYRFTGATPELNLYEGFEQRFPSGRLIKLATNYRSTQHIIHTCNRMIRWNYDEHGGPYGQVYLKDVKPVATAPEGQPVSFTMVDTPETEALMAVREIQSFMSSGYKPQDFFVGARTRAQLAYLEPWLLRAQIPFVNIAGTSFWDSRHVQDMVAFLKVAHDPYNTEAFERIYNIASNNFVHPWGDQKGEYCSHHYLPRAFFAEVHNYRECSNAVHAYRFPFKFSWKPGMVDIVENVSELQAVLDQQGIASMLQSLADNCYLKYLLKELGLEQEADGGPVDDINTLIAFSQDFETVGDFIAYVEQAREQARKAAEKSWDDSVVISTIHRLKGLERKVVIGIGLGEGYKLSAMGEIPAGLLPHTFSMTPPVNFGLLPGRAQSRMEDERCICFVLVSRAMERVVLFAPHEYQGAVFHASRFIKELGITHDTR